MYIISLISAMIGGSFLVFVQFLISRHDNKKDIYNNIIRDLAEIRSEIKKVDEKGDKREAISSRVRILRFADELQEDRKHSKDSFDQVLVDITEYENYCDTHPKFKNNQTQSTISYIKKVYSDRLEKHDFL